MPERENPAAGSPLTPEQLAEVEVIGKLVVKTDSANAPLAAGVLALVADVRYWKAMNDQQVHLKREMHERYESSRLECERARALLAAVIETWDSVLLQQDLNSMAIAAHVHGWHTNGASIQPQLAAARVFLEETQQ